MPMKNVRGAIETALMTDVLINICAILVPVIAAFLLLISIMAERLRLDIYLEDMSTLDEKIAKWRKMKKKLAEWKDEEWRKMEERRIAKEQAIAKSIKSMIGEPQ